MQLLTSLVFLLGLMATVSNAKLFALDQTSPMSKTWQLVTMAEDGTRTPVSQTGAVIKFSPGSSAIDHEHGVLYAIGQLTPYASNVTLFGVSLKTGAVVSNVVVPTAGITGGIGNLFTAGLAYASDLSEVVLMFTTAANSHVLGTIHPTTGKFTVIEIFGPSPSIGAVQPASFTYVPSRGSGGPTCIFQLGVNHAITQFAYDFKTGVTRNGTAPQITSFVYNPVDGMVWGHGITPGPNNTFWMRTLSKMDTDTLKVTPVTKLKALSVDGGGLVALDVETQTMYWPTMLFSDTSKNGGACPAGTCPVYLAAVSLTNASTWDRVPSTLLCPLWECPECSYNTTCPATLNSF